MSTKTADSGDHTHEHELTARSPWVTVLSLCLEVAASHLGATLPMSGEPEPPAAAPNLKEAKIAIDAAAALLGAVRESLDRDERLAIEGVLAQLQVEFVKRSS